MTTIYKVRTVTTVDAPERRNDTYPQVRAGTRIVATMTATTHSGAVGRFEALVSGEEDFASEYTSSIEVYSENLNTGARRTVRRRLRRDARTAAWAARD